MGELAQPTRRPALHLARTTDPDTSHDAAARVDGTALAAAALDIVRTIGPSTVDECADRLGLDRDRNKLAKRMSDLKNELLIVDSGQRREGHSGRRQIVWRATSDSDRALDW